MYCRYCTHYRESKVRFTNGEGKTKVFVRLCQPTGDHVQKSFEACEDHFSMSDEFFCDKNQILLTLAMCSNRRQNERLWPDCQNCSQSRIISELRRSIRPGVKVIPEKISQGNSKPKLRKATQSE